MKTYLLREPKTVEPQNARRVPRTRRPTAATMPEVLGRPVPRPQDPGLSIGLAYHLKRGLNLVSFEKLLAAVA